MSLISKLMLMIIAPIVILIGFITTFSLMSGRQTPFDLFSKVEAFTNNYLLIGVLMLVGILLFGFLLFVKEKFIGSS